MSLPLNDVTEIARLSDNGGKNFIAWGIWVTDPPRRVCIAQRVGARRVIEYHYGDDATGIMIGRSLSDVEWKPWTTIYKCEVERFKVAWRMAESWIYARADEMAYGVDKDTGRLYKLMEWEMGVPKTRRG